jgi:hypothetical protein
MGNGQRRKARVAKTNSFELLPACRSVKVAAGHQPEAVIQRELLGAGAGEQDILGLIHNGARQRDRILDVPQSAHGAGLQRAPVHDRRVEFVAPVDREHRSSPGIEQRVVLEHHNGARHGVQTRTAVFEHGIGGR